MAYILCLTGYVLVDYVPETTDLYTGLSSKRFRPSTPSFLFMKSDKNTKSSIPTRGIPFIMMLESMSTNWFISFAVDEEYSKPPSPKAFINT